MSMKAEVEVMCLEAKGQPKIGNKTPAAGREAWNRFFLSAFDRSQPF